MTFIQLSAAAGQWGSKWGQQTSNNNFDTQKIEETAVEGSTVCFRNTENQFMLRGLNCVIYLKGGDACTESQRRSWNYTGNKGRK